MFFTFMAKGVSKYAIPDAFSATYVLTNKNVVNL